MNVTSPNPWISGLFVLAGGALSLIGTTYVHHRTSKAAAREKVSATITELRDAVFELKTALVAYEGRWDSWLHRGHVVGLAGLEFLAAWGAGEWRQGAVRSVRTAMDWNAQSGDAANHLITVPLQRVSAALSRAALLSDLKLARAAEVVGDRVFDVLAAHHSPSTAYRPAARKAQVKEADDAMVEALSELTAIYREWLNPPPWWRRTGRWFGRAARWCGRLVRWRKADG